MENEHLLDINTDNLPMTSSPKDQSPASFSRNLIGRLGISSQGTETVIPETQSANTLISSYIITLSEPEDESGDKYGLKWIPWTLLRILSELQDFREYSWPFPKHLVIPKGPLHF